MLSDNQSKAKFPKKSNYKTHYLFSLMHKSLVSLAPMGSGTQWSLSAVFKPYHPCSAHLPAEI